MRKLSFEKGETGNVCTMSLIRFHGEHVQLVYLKRSCCMRNGASSFKYRQHSNLSI
jgi:hypothetical protein